MERREIIEEYKKLLSEYEKIEQRIPYLKKELEGINQSNSTYKFEKFLALSLLKLMDEYFIKSKKRKINDDFSILEMPLIGNLAFKWESWKGENYTNILSIYRNLLADDKKQIKGMEELIEKAEKNRQFSLFKND